MLADKQAEHARMVVRLETFDLQMMFGLAITVKSQFVGMANIAAHFFEKALVKLWALASHSLLNLVSPSNDSGLH
jgi:hypothetical protein